MVAPGCADSMLSVHKLPEWGFQELAWIATAHMSQPADRIGGAWTYENRPEAEGANWPRERKSGSSRTSEFSK